VSIPSSSRGNIWLDIKPTTGPKVPRVPVVFKPAELALIRTHTFLAGPVEERLRIGECVPGGIRVRLTADDLDELLGYVAEAATHPPSSGIGRRLDALYERLHRLEESPAFTHA
jgi:hypothetical protein